MRQPVFILGSHKSGTSLLRSLLDGVNEFFVIPIETHFFQYSGHWVDYSFRSALPGKPTFDDMVNNITQHIKLSNGTESQTSDSTLTGLWNIDRFIKYINAEGPVNYDQIGFRGFFDSYIEAIHVSLYGKPPSCDRFVEKSVENAEFTVNLKSLYPDAKFIHVIRNPYANLTAIRKYIGYKRYPFLGNALQAMKHSYYYLYKNSLLISDYMIVRYEDLVSKPLEIMESIARFIEIDFSETLLRPTVMGKAWRGNSTTGQRFNGISNVPLAAWKKEIYPLEIFLVNNFFGHVIRDYQYDKLEPRSSIYLPAQKERLKTYLKNRLLLRFL